MPIRQLLLAEGVALDVCEAACEKSRHQWGWARADRAQRRRKGRALRALGLDSGVERAGLSLRLPAAAVQRGHQGGARGLGERVLLMPPLGSAPRANYQEFSKLFIKTDGSALRQPSAPVTWHFSHSRTFLLSERLTELDYWLRNTVLGE